MTAPDAGLPGAVVRRVDHLSEVLEGSVRVGPHSTARPGVLLRVVGGVGRFLASGGDRLDYWVEPGAEPAAVEAIIQGGVMGALLHQRGDLPLHATTLVSPDRRRALALAGHSGAGKSTTAYALIRRGWILLSDDLTRITVGPGRPMAWPGRARLRLMADACARFGLAPDTLAPVPNWPGKYMLDMARWDEPVRLAAVAVLERSEGRFALERLRGRAAARALSEQTYRSHYLAALGRTEHHFELVASTAAGTAVLRTRGRPNVEELAAALEGWAESG